MAVGIRIKLTGVAQQQFDGLQQVVGTGPFDGLIIHASGPIDRGWGVLDFWQSREQVDKFAAEYIAPNMPAGMSPPDIQEFPVHEYLKP